jgi:hypothetical protein
MEQKSSPWRQPVVWLMIVLVGAVVVGSVVMLKVAGNGDSLDAVPDKVQRVGQMQQADVAPDTVAAKRKLAAILHVDDEHGFLEIFPVNGDFDRSAPLRLKLHHPIRAEQDMTVEFAPTATGWRADTKLATDHDWLLQLEAPPDSEWRLRGRLPSGQLAAQLRPAVGDTAEP